MDVPDFTWGGLVDRAQSREKESILIVSADPGAVNFGTHTHPDQLPSLPIRRVQSVAEGVAALGAGDFDVVVLDYDLPTLQDLGLIHQLRVKDHDPSVLIVSSSSDPQDVSRAYVDGCHRYVVKSNRWLEELSTAVRHSVRYRRLEEANRSLLAKLTEANILLEEKNQRLNEFSATVAHDIRAPLGALCMKLDYLRETYAEKIEKRFGDLLMRSHETAQRLIDVVQAMYELARLGAQATKMGEVALRPLILETLEDLSFDDSLDINVGVGELPTIWGNADLLRRVFINLINNAVKYTDKPQIIINIGYRGHVDRTLGRFVDIFIEDNGPGIPEAEKKDLFSIFIRGSSATAQDDGLGVGLSVVHRIVDLHFGKIQVESEVGKGTTFVLSLPVERIDFIR